jgi:hypothetical protein
MINGYITTKYGHFGVTDNGNNGTILSLNGNKVCEFPTISWWDKDNIEKALEECPDEE